MGSRRAGSPRGPLPLPLSPSLPCGNLPATRGNISIFDFESETPPLYKCACFVNPAQFLASSLAWCRFRILIQTGSVLKQPAHPRQTPALFPHLTPPTQETKGSERSSRLERAHRRSIDEKASAEREFWGREHGQELESRGKSEERSWSVGCSEATSTRYRIGRKRLVRFPRPERREQTRTRHTAMNGSARAEW